MSWQSVELLKAVLYAIAIAVLAVVVLLEHCRNHQHDRSVRWLLGVVAVFGAVAYFNFGVFHGTKYPHSIHYYDFYHYYVGAKYFDELGYYDIYTATIVADHDDDRFFDRLKGFERIRDLRSDRKIPWSDALQDAERIRSRFSDARWDEFKNDISFFLERMPERHWKNVLTDFGFNAPPTWVLSGRAAAFLGNSESLWRMQALAWLDVLLMAVAFGAVYRAFGFKAMCIGIVFFGVNYTHRYQHMGGSLLRLDWLAYLLIGISLLKQKRPIGAGFFLGWAGVLRIFPVLYLGGIVVRYLYTAWKRRELFNFDARVLASAGVTSLLFVAATLVQSPGPAAWSEFSGNIDHHSQRLTVKRIAVQYPFIYAGETSTRDVREARGDQSFYEWREARYSARAWIVNLVRLAALLAFCVAAARSETWRAAILGIVLVFCFTNPARYYWAQLLLLIPLFVTTPIRKPFALLFGYLMATMIASYAIDTTTRFYSLHQFYMSTSLAVLFCGLLIVCIRTPDESPKNRLSEQV